MDAQQQATVNVLATQRNQALDACANALGRVSVLEQECVRLAARIKELEDKYESNGDEIGPQIE